MNKPKLYTGGDLNGLWEFTYKIDGVRALRIDGQVVSRARKPLYNLDGCDFTDAEVFFGNWENSVSAVRTQGGNPVPQENVYQLDPLDPRLVLGSWENPTEEFILSVMRQAILDGYEGLVLRQESTWLKVKPKETYDVPVTGIQPGTGKHSGRMGALLTPKGKVGTGFSDAQRSALMDCVGCIIEVECMSLTPHGKFRHPRFIRVREDLPNESDQNLSR